ncbi:transposase [Novosphingobium hassiacum]|uniref:transposase n=1 Tax=Novosphingobium hassiacum TaxID=173676 RepID=UPI001C84C306
MLGGDPNRIRSESALAKLCGVCPIPASSGKPTASGFIAAAADKPMPRSIASRSYGCATIRQLSLMSANVRKTARAAARSSAASKAT